MPPTIITKESLYKRITELERKHCCNKNQFFDTFAEFPAEGAAGVLYIDKETQDIYIWDTLNEEYVLLNHTKTAKTVYVDGTYGDDTTGQRESRDFPFQTLDAAIAVCETGDLLKVFPGNYTQTVTIPVLINIDCDNGVNWLINIATFVATADFAVAVNIKWNFDKLYGSVARQIIFSNSLGEITITANEFNLVDFISNVKKDYCRINNLINSRYLPRTMIGSGTELAWSTVIENLERTVSQNYSNFAVQGDDLTKGSVHIKNLKSINSLTGYGNNPTIGYFFGSDSGVSKHYTTIIDNATHDDPNIYVSPPGVFGTLVNYNANTASGYLFALESVRNNSVHFLEIRNIKASGNLVRLRPTVTTDNAFITIKLSGVVSKGLPITFDQFSNITNSTIIIELDVVSDVMAILTGQGTGGVGITASNKVIITGRVRTTQTGYPCISIGDNTNGTILLKDLTLINDGTVSPIMTNQVSPQNVLIQNVVTNSLVVDANITEVGQSIIRNTNYK